MGFVSGSKCAVVGVLWLVRWCFGAHVLVRTRNSVGPKWAIVYTYLFSGIEGWYLTTANVRFISSNIATRWCSDSLTYSDGVVAPEGIEMRHDLARETITTTLKTPFVQRATNTFDR